MADSASYAETMNSNESIADADDVAWIGNCTFYAQSLPIGTARTNANASQLDSIPWNG